MITSTSNQQMKNLTALIKKARERKKQNAFVVEGIKMFLEAPKEWLISVYVSESFLQEEEHKKLLLKDLCERLPYGVKISVNNNIESLQGMKSLRMLFFAVYPIRRHHRGFLR